MQSDLPLPYMQRIRDWYLALGYDEPYRWARNEHLAFSHLAKPLVDSRIAIITTAAPFREGAGEQGANAPYNGKAKFFEVFAASTSTPPTLGISHVAIDRAHTTAEDINSYFPLAALQRAQQRGHIAKVSPRFYGLPTDRSVRRTSGEFAPQLLEHCHQDSVDAVLLVPNCPVCHQSVALVANHLEAADIPTVVLGCARDIIEHVGVPRLLFNDLPLGNAAGPPGDLVAQDAIINLALTLLEQAEGPSTTWQSDVSWPGAQEWKRDYSNPALLSEEQLTARREEFERVKRERDAQKPA